jgi:thiamine-phosphate pyrophosphorylase
MVRVSLEVTLERSFDGGCRWVMIREKDLDSDERQKLVETILKIAEPYNAKVVVNADLKVAEIAHGVHLPQGQSCASARATLGPEKIIGVSAHTLGEAGAAASAGADYATISPMFPTQSKPGYGPPLYLDGLKRVAGKVTIPLVALGGVTAATALSCRRAGAFGVAAMGTVMRASDPAMSVYDILNQWYAGDNEAA